MPASLQPDSWISPVSTAGAQPTRAESFPAPNQVLCRRWKEVHQRRRWSRHRHASLQWRGVSSTRGGAVGGFPAPTDAPPGEANLHFALLLHQSRSRRSKVADAAIFRATSRVLPVPPPVPPPMPTPARLGTALVSALVEVLVRRPLRFLGRRRSTSSLLLRHRVRATSRA